MQRKQSHAGNLERLDMIGDEDDNMATTQQYRCDLNTFLLHQQRCSSIEAAQLCGKIYIFILNYTEVTSLGVIQESFYCVPHSPSLCFSLHITSMKAKFKEFHNKHDMAPSIAVHSQKNPAHWLRRLKGSFCFILQS